MSIHQLKITSINMHKNNSCTQAILQTTTTDILLIQEPWYGTVATLHSDTKVEGDPQQGEAMNNMWDAHVPKLKSDSPCKALTYTHHTIKSLVRNNIYHPAAGPNTVVLDVNNSNTIAVQIINIYHNIPPHGHGLNSLLAHDLDDLETVLIIGDLNTYSPRWSLLGWTPSS
jgi:hypothetical protein